MSRPRTSCCAVTQRSLQLAQQNAKGKVGIAWRAFRNAKFESVVLDDVQLLVEDGRLAIDNLAANVLARAAVGSPAARKY